MPQTGILNAARYDLLPGLIGRSRRDAVVVIIDVVVVDVAVIVDVVRVVIVVRIRVSQPPVVRRYTDHPSDATAGSYRMHPR